MPSFSYTRSTINGTTHWQCTAEERRRDAFGSSLHRGVSDPHPSKTTAKQEAVSRMQTVLS